MKSDDVFFILLLIMKNKEPSIHSDITLQNYQFKQLSLSIFSKDVHGYPIK